MPHASGETMPRVRRHTIRGRSPRPRYGVGRAVGRAAHRHHAPRALFGRMPRRRPRSFAHGMRQARRDARRLTVQQRNAAAILRAARRLHASRPVGLSAIATALVESHLRNLPSGDRDSLGLFQQRPSQGWGSPSQIMHPSYAASRYLRVAKRQYRPGMSPAALAQLVQRSGYPGKYEQALPRARRIASSLPPTPLLAGIRVRHRNLFG